MEPSQRAFIIHMQLSKSGGPFPKNTNPGGRAPQRRQNVVQGLPIFRNLAGKNIHGSESKFTCQNFSKPIINGNS